MMIGALLLAAAAAHCADAKDYPLGDTPFRTRPGFAVFDGACPPVQTISNFNLGQSSYKLGKFSGG